MSIPTVLGCLPLLQAGVFPAVHLLEGKEGGYRGRVSASLHLVPRAIPSPFSPAIHCLLGRGWGLGEMPGPEDNHQVMKSTGPGLRGIQRMQSWSHKSLWEERVQNEGT